MRRKRGQEGDSGSERARVVVQCPAMRKRLGNRRTAYVAIVAACVFAGCPPPPVDGFPGPLPFVHHEMTFEGNLPLSVFVPDAGPPADGFPLVIITPGWNQSRGSYFPYGQQLAQWGYVAVIRFYPSPDLGSIAGIHTNDEQIRQVSAVIDWAAQQNVDPASPLYAKVRTVDVGLVGHSLGSTISRAVALYDSRVLACAQLDGWFDSSAYPHIDVLPGSSVAFLWISADVGFCGGRSAIPEAVPLIDFAEPPALEVIIDGAAHIDLLGQTRGFNRIGTIVCGGGTRDPNEVRAIAARYMIAWFNVHVQHKAEFEMYYNGAESQADVAAGTVTIISKLN